MSSSFILQTKLTPPSIKDDILRRPSLTKKLQSIFNSPLTIVQSGPGYGKSTAIATFLADSKKTYCWYSLSSYEDELIPFLTYFISAIRIQYPSFGEELIQYLNKINRYARDEEIRSFSAMLVNEMMGVDRQIVLIIDDFHLVQHSSQIEDWILWFLENMPSNLRLVFLSRTRPQWTIISNLKLKGALLEINENDLVFSMEDIEAWFTDVYSLDFSESEIAQIYQLTEGWIIALQMVIQQLSHHRDLSKLLQNKYGSMEDLFQFLAMEVLVKQPPMVQQFLEQTCIFEELTPSICDDVLGISGSKEMLDLLLQKNLFLQLIGQGQYRYHALFKEFLEQQLILQKSKYTQLHKRAAQYYRKQNLLELAIYHLEQIEQYEEIAFLLNEYGETLIQNGKLDSLLERLQRISNDQKQVFYRLHFLQGEVLRYQCLYREAEVHYQQSALLANQAGDVKGEAQALQGQAYIYLDTISPGKADRLLQRSIDIMEKNENVLSKDKAKVYLLMAENLINAGQAKKAEKWFQKALDNYQLEDVGNLESRLKLRTGNLFEAKRILQSSKNFGLHTNDHLEHAHLQQSHREPTLLLSLIECFLGKPEQAKELAETGIQEGIRYKAPFVEACGWIRMGHAVQLIDRYDLSLAKKCYDTALEMMDDLRVPRGKAEPLMGLCMLYGRDGAFEKAMEFGKKALIETDQVNDLWLSACIQLCISVTCLHAERFKDAEEWLNRAHDQFNFCGDQYGTCLTFLWKSFLYFQLEKETKFQESFTSFLNYVQIGSYEFIFSSRTTFGPKDLQSITPLLIEAQAKGIQRQYVTTLLNELGYHDVESHPGYTLRIQSLGRFRVWIGDKEVRERDWQRVKARELFELFITKRHSYLQKETIFSLVWPDTEEKAAIRDFKVAFNALHTAIEPNRKARTNPFFFNRDGQSYGLNPKASIYLDADEFERWVRAGLKEKDNEKALSFLTKGLELYDGDYLPERRYEDWCISERERLLVYYLRGAEKMAQLSVQTSNYEEAIHWCENILTKDRTWEEAYRLIMFCFYQKNNRPQAIKWYKKCCECLQDELGVEPMEPTKQMFEMITKMN
ncbi:DNA-binding SARP family transcriptional activator [Bacillus mesophilus]|uniref:Transcriptional regulator n=1 Tax=Bacillus mesophilus TaxID=1808955 RepID=A0A6M0Q6G0_9BACI|nr:DNA-binding SARP family transcriptional activator [Bacillus mesophilus]NEY70698.1 transcriptional regulator [Bacillus mesophilus]